MTEAKYPLGVQLILLVPAIFGLSFLALAFTAAHSDALIATLLVGIGLIAVFVTIFQLPTGLIVSSDTIAVRYLGGFTLSFPRADLHAEQRGFHGTTLHIRASNRSWRSRLIGSFKVNLAFISNRAELLRELGVGNSKSEP